MNSRTYQKRSYHPTGKVPYQTLINIVFKHLGVKSDRLIVGPAVGEDAAIIALGKKAIAVTTDPVTGALDNIGWISVHVNANDVATRGVRPQWYLCSILLPEKCHKNMLKDIMRQIDHAAKELRVTVVRGHTEITPGLTRPLVIGFMIGETEKGRYVTSHGADPGDIIVLTKEAGIEGTGILATDLAHVLRKEIDEKMLIAARRHLKRISVVKDSQVAMATGGVKAMHDATEGGILSGVWEMAEASKCGCVIDLSKIPLAPETEMICRYLKIDPLKIMSSGALLMAVRPNKVNAVLSNLNKAAVRATAIGKMVSLRKGRVIIQKNGKAMRLKPPKRDHLYIALEKFGDQI
jgi:hydrogenase expression/formation protein HypE